MSPGPSEPVYQVRGTGIQLDAKLGSGKQKSLMILSSVCVLAIPNVLILYLILVEVYWVCSSTWAVFSHVKLLIMQVEQPGFKALGYLGWSFQFLDCPLLLAMKFFSSFCSATSSLLEESKAPWCWSEYERKWVVAVPVMESSSSMHRNVK